MVFLFRAALLFLLFTPVPAFADTPLIYKTDRADIRIRQTEIFLRDTGLLLRDAPYDIATVDLNGDGVDEYIFRMRRSGCETRGDCRFLVTGLSARKPLLIAAYQARNIGISGEKTYGVRGLLVYNRENDDFAARHYRWNPRISAFEAE